MDREASFYDISEASAASGVEAARIRFFHREFGDFFRAPSNLAGKALFDDRDLDLLKRIDRWIFADGLSVGDVLRHLGRQTGSARIIAVTSGKGGVGKTTVALNLAVALAGSGTRTLLFDADMGLANVHVFAGVDPGRTVLDLISGAAGPEQVLVTGPGGVAMLCGGSGIAGLADLDPRAVADLGSRLTRMADDFDVIVIDTGAGIGSQVLEFLRIADDIVVIVTPDIASTLDAYGVIKVSREARFDGRIHVVVNMAETPGESQAVSERLLACARRFLNYAPGLLGWLPRDRAVQDANQQRRPLLISDPEADTSRRFADIADALMAGAPGVSSAGTHRLASLVGRLRAVGVRESQRDTHLTGRRP
jgi:flagellar biosynthesis protein FlhG